MSTCSVLVITPAHDLWVRLGLILPDHGFLLGRASDQQRGLAQIDSFDMLLVDGDQPGWDYATIRLFCARASHERLIPLLVLSDDSDETLVTTWLDAGALDHLPRAFRPAILCARLQAHLRLYRRQPTSPITIGDCVFHPAKRLLIAGATHIHLTITETAILACLTAQSEPVAWTELYQTVWGTPFRNRPSRIDGHVWRLRRKIAGRFLIKIEPAGYSVGCWEDETMPVLAEAV